MKVTENRPPPPEPTYTIELDAAEANILRGILWCFRRDVLQIDEESGPFALRLRTLIGGK